MIVSTCSVLAKREYSFGNQRRAVLICQSTERGDDADIFQIRFDRAADAAAFKRGQRVSLPVKIVIADGQASLIARTDTAAQEFLAANPPRSE